MGEERTPTHGTTGGISGVIRCQGQSCLHQVFQRLAKAWTHCLGLSSTVEHGLKGWSWNSSFPIQPIMSDKFSISQIHKKLRKQENLHESIISYREREREMCCEHANILPGWPFDLCYDSRSPLLQWPSCQSPYHTKPHSPTIVAQLHIKATKIWHKPPGEKMMKRSAKRPPPTLHFECKLAGRMHV